MFFIIESITRSKTKIQKTDAHNDDNNSVRNRSVGAGSKHQQNKNQKFRVTSLPRNPLRNNKYDVKVKRALIDDKNDDADGGNFFK